MDTTYEEFKKQALKDPEVKREYDRLKPKFKKIAREIRRNNMGYWKSSRGICGDSWADIMGNCMKTLQANKRESGDELIADHEITMQEFADLVEFCTRGHLVCDVRFFDVDGGRPLSQLGNWGVETYSNGGQIHCPELCESK